MYTNHRKRPMQPGNNGHVCTPRDSTRTLAKMSNRKTTNGLQPWGAVLISEKNLHFEIKFWILQMKMMACLYDVQSKLCRRRWLGRCPCGITKYKIILGACPKIRFCEGTIENALTFVPKWASQISDFSCCSWGHESDTTTSLVSICACHPCLCHAHE